MKFVKPKVYLIAEPQINVENVRRYLRDTNQEDFDQAQGNMWPWPGYNDPEVLISFMAKLCYRSLTVGQNKNITQTRTIEDNLKNILEQGHGSVLRHAYFSFVVEDCSRIFTHEMVRHGVGVEPSQESGRYVRREELRIVDIPGLKETLKQIELAFGRELFDTIEEDYNFSCDNVDIDDLGRDEKKAETSLLRRLLPQGQATTIGLTMNVQAIRHCLMMRTSPHAEWEMRYIFDQVYNIMEQSYPTLFRDGNVEVIDDLIHVKDMKMQPYDN